MSCFLITCLGAISKHTICSQARLQSNVVCDDAAGLDRELDLQVTSSFVYSFSYKATAANFLQGSETAVEFLQFPQDPTAKALALRIWQEVGPSNIFRDWDSPCMVKE